MSSLDRKFKAMIDEHYKVATPGIQVQAFHRGRKILDAEAGDTHLIYDWASVTKIVFTTTALMLEYDEASWRPTDPIGKWVHWFPDNSTWQVRDLLTHSAGLFWWYPFYKQLEKKTTAATTPEEAWGVFETILKRRVLADFKKNGPRSLKRRALKSVYSDLDFFMLGLTLEAITEKSLYEAWTDVRERLSLKSTDFHRNNRSPRAHRDVAPTEDCRWRGKVLKGEAHDQNTWSLKGVAPHAGLFGPIDDLSRWGLILRSSLRGAPRKYAPSEKAARLFTRRALSPARGDWALGFMMPSKDIASCGPRFSRESIGHTGYTGTSLWLDPKKDLLVTVLSNRVHPSVENIEIRKLRPMIHTWIASQL